MCQYHITNCSLQNVDFNEFRAFKEICFLGEKGKKQSEPQKWEEKKKIKKTWAWKKNVSLAGLTVTKWKWPKF